MRRACSLIPTRSPRTSGAPWKPSPPCTALKCMTHTAFVEDVFFRRGYELRATIVGFNLPFDISRLALGWVPARGKMRGGFSFKMSEKWWRPRVQIKHLSGRAAFIQFTSPTKRNDNPRDRREGRRIIRRGSFVDVRTIAGALLSQSFSLDGLARHLKTETQKAKTEEHGGVLTDQYLGYAVTDVQATWECYLALSERFSEHDLGLTRLSQVLSEASLGKAYLRQMGVRPWRELQPDFPNALLGAIMSSYFGGRAEVHLRREVRQVLYCDFLSMYPTVCTLMGLWQFVIAKEIRWRDATEEATSFLNEVTLADLRDPATWPRLTTLVQIAPDDDVVPVRAPLHGRAAGDDRRQSSFAAASRSGSPWRTASRPRFLTGKAPRVVKAVGFEPGAQQEGLTPIRIAGDPNYEVDPATNDFYRRLIDLRSSIKTKMKSAAPEEREALDALQLALKILANATSYGIFVELIVDEADRKQSLTCFGAATMASRSVRQAPQNRRKVEKPGSFFHPLLATLITGAARLLLSDGRAAVLGRRSRLGVRRHRQHGDRQAERNGLTRPFSKRASRSPVGSTPSTPMRPRDRCSRSKTSTMASARRTLRPSTAMRSPPSATRCSISAPMGTDLAQGVGAWARRQAGALRRGPGCRRQFRTRSSSSRISALTVGSMTSGIRSSQRLWRGRFDVVPSRLSSSPPSAGHEPICGDDTGHFELVQDLQRRSAIRLAGEAVQFPVGVSRDVLLRSFIHR